MPGASSARLIEYAVAVGTSRHSMWIAVDECDSAATASGTSPPAVVMGGAQPGSGEVATEGSGTVPAGSVDRVGPVPSESSSEASSEEFGPLADVPPSRPGVGVVKTATATNAADTATPTDPLKSRFGERPTGRSSTGGLSNWCAECVRAPAGTVVNSRQSSSSSRISRLSRCWVRSSSPANHPSTRKFSPNTAASTQTRTSMGALPYAPKGPGVHPGPRVPHGALEKAPERP